MISFDEVMQLTRTVSSHTAFEDEECRRLYDLCMKINPGGIVVEIGCQIGRTSSIILQCAKAKGYRSVHIDPYCEDPSYLPRWISMMHAIDYPFTFLCMRTEQAAKQLRDIAKYGISMLLIDGDHSADGVRKDCVHAAQLIYPSGILCAHDFGRTSLPDVYEVLSKYTDSPKWKDLGVSGTLGVWHNIGDQQ